MTVQTEQARAEGCDLRERMETHAEDMRNAFMRLASLWGLSQQQELH